MTSKFYPLAHDSWDEREIDALQEVIKSRQFTMGPKVAEFETAIAKFHNRVHHPINRLRRNIAIADRAMGRTCTTK